MFLIIIATILTLYVLKVLSQREKDLTDQVVLVTGGANGLGKELCKRFGELGCKVAIADLDLPNAEKTVAELREKGVEAHAYKVDVSVLKDIEDLRINIERDLGVVDMVVNNAGILYCKPVENEDPKMLEKIMQVNTMSVFWTTRVFLPGMKERRSGHIVTIASVAAFLACPHLRAYSASKFALRGFMEGLHADLHREGLQDCIQQTTVYPWFIKTNEFIKDFTTQVFKRCYKLRPEYVAQKIIEGVRRDEKDVTVPGIMWFFGYVFNVSYFGILYFKLFGPNYVAELDVNYKAQ